MRGKLTLLVAAVGTAGIAGAAVMSAAPGAAGGVISLMAASPSPANGTNKTNQNCQDFINHFRQNLGVSQSKLNASFKDAVDQTIDDAVRAGRLNAAQAAKLKQRVANRSVCAGFRGALERPEAGVFGKAYLDAATVALHFSSSADLQAQLRSGKTLSQIAGERNVSESAFRASLVSQLKPKLDQAKSQRKITDAQEQKILSRLQTGPLPLWNKSIRHPRPAGTNGPTPTTAPSQS